MESVLAAATPMQALSQQELAHYQFVMPEQTSSVTHY